MTLRLSPTALSVFETDILDDTDAELDDGYDALRRAFSNGALRVDSSNAEEIANRLTDLANHCDYLVEDRAALDPFEKKIYRSARGAFSTLASKARRAA